MQKPSSSQWILTKTLQKNTSDQYALVLSRAEQRLWRLHGHRERSRPPVTELVIPAIEQFAIARTRQCDGCRWRLNALGGHGCRQQGSFLVTVEPQSEGLE